MGYPVKSESLVVKVGTQSVKPVKPITRRIPVFDQMGVFKNMCSPGSAQSMIGNNFAVPIRNRKGYVVSVHLVGDSADGKRSTSSPIRSTAHVGTRYSFQDKLESGDRPWDLKRLSGKRGGLNYAPTSVRGIFLEVLVSCMVPAVAPEPA